MSVTYEYYGGPLDGTTCKLSQSTPIGTVVATAVGGYYSLELVGTYNPELMACRAVAHWTQGTAPPPCSTDDEDGG